MSNNTNQNHSNSTHSTKHANICHIIGILENGEQSLNQHAIHCLKNTDVLIGSPRFMDSIQSLLKINVEKKDFSGHIMQVPEWVQSSLAKNKKVVVLATGDPLCHGIGAFLVKKLGVDQCQFIPNISMFQVAFSRLGLAWQGVKICSIHTKDMGEWTTNAPFDHGLRRLLNDCKTNDLIACYTSPENSPKRIAQMLNCEKMSGQFQLVIATNLTADNENISSWLNIDKVANERFEQRFSDPNLVILKRISAADNPILMGLADESYFQRKPDKGLITKQEIRAVSLAKMQLKRDSIVWDIGAGSGSIGLEAAHLCPQGRVYAIEKNESDVAIVQQNVEKSSLSNYHIEWGKAPEGLSDWEDADAIFIGGSGGNLADLIHLCVSRLNKGGHLVMNFVTLENISVATETLKTIEKTAYGIEWQFIQMQVSRSKPILTMQRLQAENPVYIVTATLLRKKGNK